jgi:hypothetical protein
MSEQNSGIGVGAVLGMLAASALSWTKWHSIFWLVINAAFGWPYVIYHLIRYGFPK